MNDTAQTEGQEAATVAKTVIRPDLKRYVRTKSGNGKRTHRTDDLVARLLAGKTLDEVKAGATAFQIDHAKWGNLNPGQQRMLIGNALRQLQKQAKDPVSSATLISIFGEPVAEYVAPPVEAAAEGQAEGSAENPESAQAAGEAEEAAAESAPTAGKRKKK